jgi:hypothetical protein
MAVVYSVFPVEKAQMRRPISPKTEAFQVFADTDV